VASWIEAALAQDLIFSVARASTYNPMEAQVKSSLIDISEKVILLADSSKIGKSTLPAFADFESINIFITD